MRKILFLIFVFASCTPSYNKEMKSITWSYTKINLNIIEQLTDSLHKEGKYKTPDHLKEFEYPAFLRNVCYRSYYFKNSPEEIYNVILADPILPYQPDNMIQVHIIYDVKNKRLINGSKEASIHMKDDESFRVDNRMRGVLLDILKKGKEYGIHDTIMFYDFP